MKRSGFTMIELIFVIVILGILAAVAIPRLAATRDDAQASKLAVNVKTAMSEIAAWTVSQGQSPITAAAATQDVNLTASSNAIREATGTGFFRLAALTTNTLTNGREIQVWDRPTGGVQCGAIEVNGSHMFYDQETNNSVICTSVNRTNPEGNVSIAGQGVRF